MDPFACFLGLDPTLRSLLRGPAPSMFPTIANGTGLRPYPRFHLSLVPSKDGLGLAGEVPHQTLESSPGSIPLHAPFLARSLPRVTSPGLPSTWTFHSCLPSHLRGLLEIGPQRLRPTV